jgi:hypothetical protein
MLPPVCGMLLSNTKRNLKVGGGGSRFVEVSYFLVGLPIADCLEEYWSVPSRAPTRTWRPLLDQGEVPDLLGCLPDIPGGGAAQWRVPHLPGLMSRPPDCILRQVPEGQLDRLGRAPGRTRPISLAAKRVD